VNRLSYAQSGDPRWKVAMPTFLVDGRDLCDWLGLIEELQQDAAGVGAMELTDPYIFRRRTVLHRQPPGTSERQTVLSIHLGDIIGPFASVNVRVFDDRIEWSEFDSMEGVRTPLAACGPFVFAKLHYLSVMAPLCRSGLVTAQQYWPADLIHSEAINETWAADG